MKSIINELDFHKHHTEQVHHRSQRDIFFIWLLLMFISVLGAHFVLNFTGGSPTGFVTAAGGTPSNMMILLGAFLVLFIVVLITALVYVGLSKKDY